ncbi:hypothetical protein GUY44_18235 [Pimelobacter simplex]|uniref:Uncharacterized protein n=1 Tax=Nocardioides simplex TaxID=2045 RepID=A0A0A1DTT7_NOCSI|nr:DUF202 domain-containing protein [Pimelobacter simplex]AIY18830.1 hypothetical protein KR76_22340 [Pimelobacter simplex]MCG8152431.1 hypothetical protein [Pimelobacter simplex]GEB14545.1 hypothetical protein NSI01_28600 [Pimelobacter simplex]SFM28419.1 protein of unknown function [Pimelobacter simplex]
MSAATYDASRSAERTALAWQRTLLAAVLVALVPLHDLSGAAWPVLSLSGAVAVLVALAVARATAIPFVSTCVVAADCVLALATALVPGGSR